MIDPRQIEVGAHQSLLPPDENKFHRGNGNDGKHYWLTPPELYAALDSEFHFDFDPCPFPLPEGFDGLTCEWGQSNYVNPPFGSIIHQGKKKGPTAWVRKAIEEHTKGKTVVLVYPVDKWVLMMLSVIGSKVRNLGDVRWLSVEDGKPGKGTGRHIAAFILGGERVKQNFLHGVAQSYWNGCRCFRCRVAQSDYQRFRYLERAKGRRKDCRKAGRARAAIRGIGSQSEIAELLGIGQATVSRILAGKKIRPSTEAKVLRAANAA